MHKRVILVYFWWRMLHKFFFFSFSFSLPLCLSVCYMWHLCNKIFKRSSQVKVHIAQWITCRLSQHCEKEIWIIFTNWTTSICNRFKVPRFRRRIWAGSSPGLVFLLREFRDILPFVGLDRSAKDLTLAGSVSTLFVIAPGNTSLTFLHSPLNPASLELFLNLSATIWWFFQVI